MSVKRMNTHIITLSAMAVLLLAGCRNEDEPKALTSDKAVAVNLANAEGAAATLAAASDNYGLMFWYGQKNTDALTALTGATPWLNYLNDKDEVDEYKFGVGEYPVVNGTAVYYPDDNSPIHAVGFYPAKDSLAISADGKSFTVIEREIALKRSDPDDSSKEITVGYDYYMPGLIDVCSTEIETGTESVPFISSKDHELQFGHTQVKLNFHYQRTANLNARVAEIWVSIPSRHVANQWTLTEEGYQASYVESLDETKSPLVFASTHDYYEETPKLHSLRYTNVKRNVTPVTYYISEKPHCYVLPDYGTNGVDGLFSGVSGSQQSITFQLDAVLISSGSNIPTRRYSRKVTVPLTDDKTGAPWTNTVQPGDAFNITITFDSKNIQVLAQKGGWSRGSWIVVPLDPSK